ncbi:MAG: NAD(P)-dependent oxidoreductase [Devosia nanyangense]|uniref:NAD(P)-dependent oxidoreductase n=1 Tax=Devosia nanyangense TaxID=1228055 RepID=A0A933L447_9HYPH|nr:NAD(P)-dependent oxidoreductase [Devosia nanyangense]
MARTVLITGAAGNVGAKLAAHLSTDPRYALTRMDLKGGPGILGADLATYSDDWASEFEGVDTVFHLAGEIRPKASWAQVHRGNVLLTGNVLRASRRAGVRRVVFASTNQVVGGYRFRDELVTADLPPAPLNPYGVSKLICEELGRAFAAETGISFIAFRIGNFPPGNEAPGPWLGIGAWGQEMWLSSRDMLNAMERAIEAESVDFAVLNLVSDNPGMRWDIEATKRSIGYAPRDGHRAEVTDEVAAEDAEARASVLIPGSWLDQFGRRLEG